MMNMTMSTLVKRTITSLILAPLVIIGIFISSVSIWAAAVGLILLVAGFEWAGLINLVKNTSKIVYVIGLIILFAGIYFSLDNFIIFVYIKLFFFLSVLLWLILTAWVFLFQLNPKLTIKTKWLLALLGYWILLATWLALVELKQCWHGPWLILFLLMLIWVVDTFAYLFGRKFGKQKLIPNVSPNKTFAGLWGGLTTGLLWFVIAYFTFLSPKIVFLDWLLITISTMLIAVIGDLFISVLKRQSQIKDTGNVIPGHGGILDRLDSLLAAAPMFSFLLLLLQH